LNNGEGNGTVKKNRAGEPNNYKRLEMQTEVWGRYLAGITFETGTAGGDSWGRRRSKQLREGGDIAAPRWSETLKRRSTRKYQISKTREAVAGSSALKVGERVGEGRVNGLPKKLDWGSAGWGGYDEDLCGKVGGRKRPPEPGLVGIGGRA